MQKNYHPRVRDCFSLWNLQYVPSKCSCRLPVTVARLIPPCLARLWVRRCRALHRGRRRGRLLRGPEWLRCLLRLVSSSELTLAPSPRRQEAIVGELVLLHHSRLLGSVVVASKLPGPVLRQRGLRDIWRTKARRRQCRVKVASLQSPSGSESARSSSTPYGSESTYCCRSDGGGGTGDRHDNDCN